jgi:Uma2 family endonuclease
MTTISERSPLNILKVRHKSTLKDHTLAFYLDREYKAKFKSEFYKGKILKIAGASYSHNKIATNILVSLSNKIKNLTKKFVALNSDQKVYIPSKNSVLYPDALVIAEKPEFWEGRKDIITNPLIIVEVLSPSSQLYDVFDKFHLYQELPTFTEYIIVSQSANSIEQWFRKDLNTWIKSEMNSMDQVLKVNSLSFEIPLSEIYEDVEFE